MKFHTLLGGSLLVLFLERGAAFSQNHVSHPSLSVSVKLPTGLARLLAEGSVDDPKGEMSCYVVLYGMPGFQNAQAQGACYEAQTACLRLGLFQQFLTPEKNTEFKQLYPGTSFQQEDLEEAIQLSIKEVKLKLIGCAVATAASIITDSVVDQAGFVSPVEMAQHHNSSPPSDLQLSSPPVSREELAEPSSLDPLPEESSGEQDGPSQPIKL